MNGIYISKILKRLVISGPASYSPIATMKYKMKHSWGIFLIPPFLFIFYFVASHPLLLFLTLKTDFLLQCILQPVGALPCLQRSGVFRARSLFFLVRSIHVPSGLTAIIESRYVLDAQAMLLKPIDNLIHPLIYVEQVKACLVQCFNLTTRPNMVK